MIRSSKEQIKRIVKEEYIKLLEKRENKDLNETELQELGRLWKKYKGMRKYEDPGVHPSLGAKAQQKRKDSPHLYSSEPVVDPEYVGLADELEPEWDPLQTQQMSRTIDIDPGEKRPMAKKVGLAELEQTLDELEFDEFLMELELENFLNK